MNVNERKIVGLEDLVLLSKVDEESIVSNLEKRFAKNEIYTNIGNVLISCNPFKPLSIYEPEYVKLYENAVLSDLPPHVYAVAESAFRTMINEDEKQCVIISGESGAGKTEAAKGVMSYIAAVSGSGGNDSSVTHIKNVVLDSNPALESFGNAMTLRNNNSSRFGKYFEIRFELANGGTPQGGYITNYLLEKSRIVKPGKGERSFHIFYQLFGNADVKSKLGLGKPGDFNMLSQSGVLQINNEGGRVDDFKEFDETRNSMQVVGIDPNEQMNFFTIVAIAMHLSNVDFVDKQVGSAEGSAVTDRRFLEWPAALLGVGVDALEYALTYRTLTTTGAGATTDSYQVPMNATQARAARDALAKDLYARTFDALVRKVNDTLAYDEQHTRSGAYRNSRLGRGGADDDDDDDQPGKLSIGVLDIFGFEIFDENRFEQFCINYVNEKLQQVFINLTIKSEQEDYAHEGIQWTAIPFFDNQIVCELIEGRRPPGVFSILDDTCKTLSKMSSVDDKFLETLKQYQSTHKHFTPVIGGFVIKHYAGDVQYTIDGFIDSNKDILSTDLRLLAKSSSNPFIQNLYPEEVNLDSRKAPTTAGYKIKTQSGDLVYALLDCNAHYIRCIKSNDRKKGGLFESPRVLHQVRYLGLLENVKVRRAGFAFRMEFYRFINRYRVLCSGKVDPKLLADGTDAQIAKVVHGAAAQYLPILNSSQEVQMGQTKIFIKTPETVFELQKIRKRLIGLQVIKIQNLFRRYITRKELLNLRSDMSEMWKLQDKEFTPSDLVRPFSAFYVKEQDKVVAISALLEMMESRYGKKEKTLYTDSLQKLDRQGKWIDVIFFITDSAFYYGTWGLQAIGPKPSKGQAQQGYKLTLLRRTSLKDIESVTLSKLADDLISIRCNLPMKLAQPDKSHYLNKDQVSRCMETQTKFSFFGRHKHRCNFTGGIYIREMVATKMVIPDRGFYTPVPVHHSVVGTFSVEPQEDVVLLSDKKIEIVSILRDAVSRAKGIVPVTSAAPPAAPAGKPTCRALYDYAGDPASGALAFRAGDVMDIVSDTDVNWWQVTMRGTPGIVPANYVERLPMSQAAAPRPMASSPGALNIQFTNMWQVRASIAAPQLSNTFNGNIEVTKVPQIKVAMYQPGSGRYAVSVPPGVSSQRLAEIQNNQRIRQARREAERARLNQIREENSRLREQQRADEKQRRIAQRKERRAAERRQLHNQRGQVARGGNHSPSPEPTRQAAPWQQPKPAAQPAVVNKAPSNNQIRAAPAAPKPKAAPSPWQEILDPSSGNNYYYNSETGATQWDKPAGFGSQKPLAPAAGSSRNTAGASASSSAASSSAAASSASSAPAAGNGTLTLAALLEAKKNGASGMDPTQLECYLLSSEFTSAFGMDSDTFFKQPKWKRDQMKKKAGLY